VLRRFFAQHPEHRDLHARAMGYFYADAAITYREAGRRFDAIRCVAQSAWHCPLGVGFEPSKTRFSRSKFTVRTMLGPRAFAPSAH